MQMTRKAGFDTKWIWGGALAALVTLGAVAWGLGWFGGEDTAIETPAIEQQQ